MSLYELYSLSDEGDVIDSSIFRRETDDDAINLAEAVALAGGKVAVWRDGVKLGVLERAAIDRRYDVSNIIAFGESRHLALEEYRANGSDGFTCVWSQTAD